MASFTPDGPLEKAVHSLSKGKITGLMIYTNSFPGWRSFGAFVSHLRQLDFSLPQAHGFMHHRLRTESGSAGFTCAWQRRRAARKWLSDNRLRLQTHKGVSAAGAKRRE
jgi:hypothetical protein